MLGPDELRGLCRAYRDDPGRRTDSELVDRIESEVQRYRSVRAGRPVQLPPAPLDQLLPLLGWLIYETSWEALQRVVTAFDRLDEQDDRRRESEGAVDQIGRLADAARQLPWPEFAPRALGAIRAQALVESKRDRESGYESAWILHREARKKYVEFRDCHGTGPDRERYTQAIDDVLLQLALAETGTACRTAERVIGRWAEEFADPADPDRSRAAEQRWVQRMFHQLTEGLEVGELAIGTAYRIREERGFVDQVCETRLTLRNALQNPGIMSARAALLLLPLGREMDRLGRRAPGTGSWQRWEAGLLCRFEQAYRAIEEEVTDQPGDPVPVRPDLQRQLVHIRLDLGLLKPGYDLPSGLSFAPGLRINPLDDTAVRSLTEWLATPDGRGRWRGFEAATMPSFIRSVVAGRSRGPADRGYQRWRREWFRYEQYAAEPGRRDRVEAALAAATG